MWIAKTIFKIASKRGFVNRHRLFDRASRVATWTRTAVDRSMLETRAAIESRPPLETSTLARKPAFFVNFCPLTFAIRRS